MFRIVEVGPRDGLQNEAVVVPTDVKVAFIDALSESGVREIEAGAFVSPKWIPQLADTDEVFRRIRRKAGVVYSGLVPNERGLERAEAADVHKIAVFTAASETFNQKNINCSIDESFRRFEPVLARAKVPVRGYVSMAFWCPYEGRISADRAVDVCRRLIDAGCAEVSVGDTMGRAVPAEVRTLVERLLRFVPASNIAMHFHDTYGHAADNVRASLGFGIETFDSSAGGIGGCPYAPGASGNISTEALARILGDTGVDPVRLEAARRIIEPSLGRSI